MAPLIGVADSCTIATASPTLRVLTYLQQVFDTVLLIGCRL